MGQTLIDWALENFVIHLQAMKLGATVAIIENGKILMTKRSDFEVWCLPGGHVDESETAAEAAIREAREEVGLEVRLERFVGVYFRLGGEYSIALHLFAATPVGGRLQVQPDEVLEIGYFEPDALPGDMFWWHQYQVQDAMSGVTGAVWRLEVVPAQQVDSRQALYDLQAEMGLAPAAFYKYFFESNGTHRVRREI